MLVFLRRIPVGTRKNEIESFIADVVKGGLFSISGQIKSITIIERRNPLHSQVTDYHSVVNIEPDKVAERVIKKLNRKMFKGKYMEVRRYYLRSSANDPRRRKGQIDTVPDNRRKTERRHTAEEKSAGLSFSGVKDFHRKG